MKKPLLLLSFLLTVMYGSAQTIQRQNATYTPLETIITDLNADKLNDTISLYELPAEGDPGSFRKMNVSVNGRRMTFHARDAWHFTDTDFAKANTNDVKSKLAFVHKEEGLAYVLLFGYPYPSGREELFILQVKGRKMEILFHNKMDEPQLLADLNNDGHAELIVRKPPEMYKITEDGEVGAYSPFLVYTLYPVLDINRPLTRQYNEEHYLWSGMLYDENIDVLYPKNGDKPKLIKPE